MLNTNEQMAGLAEGLIELGLAAPGTIGSDLDRWGIAGYTASHPAYERAEMGPMEYAKYQVIAKTLAAKMFPDLDWSNA